MKIHDDQTNGQLLSGLQSMTTVYGHDEAHEKMKASDTGAGRKMNFIQGIGRQRHGGGDSLSSLGSHPTASGPDQVTPGYEGVSGIAGPSVGHENDAYNPNQSTSPTPNEQGSPGYVEDPNLYPKPLPDPIPKKNPITGF